MDLGKESRFFAAYGDCWKVMKEFCDASTDDERQAYYKKSRELSAKYPEFYAYIESAMYHYGVIISRQIKESEDARKEARKAEAKRKPL